MIRKTLTIFSLIGLLLSVGLWGASYWGLALTWSNSKNGGMTSLGITKGGFFYHDISPLWLTSGRMTEGLVVQGFIDFDTWWWPQGSFFFLPFWIPGLVCLAFLLFTVLPFHRRRKRKKLGLCLKCGYDLRASKDRCPECGEAKNEIPPPFLAEEMSRTQTSE